MKTEPLPTSIYSLFVFAVKKSFAEMEALAKKKEEQRKLRDARRKAQDARVQQKSAKGLKGKSRSKEVPAPEAAVEDDDIEWYRQEVGEEPDAEEQAELRNSTKAAPKREKFNPLYRKRKKPTEGDSGDAKRRKLKE